MMKVRGHTLLDNLKAALETIDPERLTRILLCPFVALDLQRNPEWNKLIMKGINRT